MIVEIAGDAHLPHRRIPVPVLGLPRLQLLPRVDRRADVMAMLRERGARPDRESLPAIVIGAVMDVVHRELAADDHLLEVGARRLVRPAVLHRVVDL